MKPSKLSFYGLFLIVFFTACTENLSDLERLRGTWDMVELEYLGTALTVTPNGDLYREFTGTGKNFNSSIEFIGNSNYASSGTHKIDLNTLYNGSTTEQELLINEFIGAGIFTVNSELAPSQITFNSNFGLTTTGTIDLLSDDRLELTIVGTVNDSDGVNTITTTIQQVIAFTKN